jgi:phytanoyl-CoA dioxygenase PhyH
METYSLGLSMSTERQSRPRGAEKQLLGRLALRKDEVRTRLALASDRTYWKSLYPSFSICDGASFVPEVPSFETSTLCKAKSDLASRSYFLVEGAIAGSIIGPMLGCVEAVRKAGWPPVFAYIYDQLWLVWRLAPVEQLLTAGLGPGYRWIPHGWCHYVHPVSGASGWPPHVDGNLSNRMSIWLPLTDATLDNGCIYVVPSNLNAAGIGERRALRAASNLQMRELLQRGRALPARAGSVLGWYFRILHWGSVCHAADGPRVSLVMEFIGADERALDSELPLFDPQGPLPALPQRLHAIGRAILQYKRFELRMRRYVELAHGLMKEAGVKPMGR